VEVNDMSDFQLDITNPAILDMAAAHIVSDLGQEIRERCGIDPQSINMELFRSYLVITANIAPFVSHVKRRENHEYLDNAKNVLVQRQAHTPLMAALFGLSRHEVTRLRKLNGALRPSTATSHYSNEEIAMVYRCWQRVNAQFKDPIEMWCHLALLDELRTFPLSAIYEIIQEGV